METTAIVTGASGGIGAAIAFELASNGVHTIMLSRDIAKLIAAAKTIFTKGKYGAYFQCDVTDRNDIEKIIRFEQERFNRSKIILINNAGYGGPFQRTDETSEEEWDRIFDTNVKAAFLFCKQLLPIMKEKSWGRVINIASIYGSVGGSLSSAYAASKHALAGYTKSIAAEWGEHNITCNCISPGFIDTAMGASGDEVYSANIIAQIPSKRQGTPEEIAKLVMFLCSDAAAYINGANLIVDGGLTGSRSFR